MKINKKEALALAKVLHQHTGSALPVGLQSEHDETIHKLVTRLDHFIMVDGADGADGDHVDDDYLPKKSPVKKEERPCDFLEDSDDEDDEDGEQEMASDNDVDAGDLHELTPVKATNGTIEFEYVFDDQASRLNLLLDGETIIEYVTHLRRHRDSLEVKASARDWTAYEVNRFPKGWASLLPIHQLLTVEY